MKEEILPVGVNAAAILIASYIEDDLQLALLAATLTQLADTLAVIVAERAIKNDNK